MMFSGEFEWFLLFCFVFCANGCESHACCVGLTLVFFLGACWGLQLLFSFSFLQSFFSFSLLFSLEVQGFWEITKKTIKKDNKKQRQRMTFGGGAKKPFNSSWFCGPSFWSFWEWYSKKYGLLY